MVNAHFRPGLSLSLRDVMLAIALCVCAYATTTSAELPADAIVSSADSR